MADWAQVRDELGRYEQARARDDEVVIAWRHPARKEPFAVVVRRIEACGASWLRVSAPIGYARHASLEDLLRRVDAAVGAMVIEGARCVLRETVRLAHVPADAVHTLITTIGGQAAELARTMRVIEAHAYAEGFAT